MASKKELKALITLAGKVDPSLQQALKKAVGANDKLTKSIKQSSKQSKIFGDMFKANVLGNLAVNAFSQITSSIINLGSESIRLASDLQEVQNVVDTTFKDNATQIDAWAKTTLQAYGITELQAKQWSGTMGAMLKSSGVTEQDMMMMSTTLAGLAGDFASFYNLQHDEAWEKIRSGISGETEPLKQLGINMSVANLEAFAMSKGIDKAFQKMTQAEQTLLRYNYLMEVSADAQGDFSKTSGSFANQQKLLTNTLQQMGATIAGKALPMLTKLLQKSNEVVAKIDLDKVFEGFSQVAEYISPLIPHIQSFGQTFLDLGKRLMPLFMNMLQKISDVVMKLIPPILKIIQILGQVGAIITSTIMPVLNVVMDILKPIIDQLVAILTPILEKISSLLSALAPVLQQNAAVFSQMINIMTSGLQSLIGVLMPVVDNIFVILGGIIDFVTGIFTGNWQLAWQGVMDIFSGLWNGLASIVKAPLNFVIEMINKVISGINGIQVPDWVPSIGGKGINIPLIPTFAKGGIATQASIFGEAGPEMAIPLKKTSRSIGLLAQTANILGVNLQSQDYEARSSKQGLTEGIKPISLFKQNVNVLKEPGVASSVKKAEIVINVHGEQTKQYILDIKEAVRQALQELDYEEEVMSFG